MKVNSDTRVENLNADKLDGHDSPDFARAALFGSAVNGRIGSGTSSAQCVLGQVELFAGSAPQGWEPAAGQQMDIQSYPALYSVLGTTYGGDGRTTFALPDLRGAEPKGAGPAPPFYAICVLGTVPG